MSRTVQTSLNDANPNSIADRLRQVALGNILARMIPQRLVRTGLASSATQVETTAGYVHMVQDSSDTTLTLIGEGDTIGAGKCRVTYDASGFATLLFNGAVTGYKITLLPCTDTLAADLAADAGGV